MPGKFFDDAHGRRKAKAVASPSLRQFAGSQTLGARQANDLRGMPPVVLPLPRGGSDKRRPNSLALNHATLGGGEARVELAYDRVDGTDGRVR